MASQVIAYIPAYNEADRIAAVVRSTRPHVADVIVLDDGSSDQTSSMSQDAGATVISHQENLGKGAAIITCLKHFADSEASLAVFLDADGQHEPSEISAFVQAAEETGAGMVIGNRMDATQGMPLRRRFANWSMSRVISHLAGQRIPDSQCGYRLLSRHILDKLKLQSHRFETETEMLIQAGRAGEQIVSVPIQTIYQPDRQSHIAPIRDALRFLRLLWRCRK